MEMRDWHRTGKKCKKKKQGLQLSGWFESLLNESYQSHTSTWEGSELDAACRCTTYEPEDSQVFLFHPGRAAPVEFPATALLLREDSQTVGMSKRVPTIQKKIGKKK